MVVDKKELAGYRQTTRAGRFRWRSTQILLRFAAQNFGRARNRWLQFLQPLRRAPQRQKTIKDIKTIINAK